MVGCASTYGFLVMGLVVFFKVDGFSALVQSSVLGKGVKHKPPPIKLSSGSSTSSSGKQLFMEDMQLCRSYSVFGDNCVEKI